MNSIGPNCNEFKKNYDACFQNWFKNHFLKGETDDSMCREQFQQYNECVRKAMKDQQIDLKQLEQEVLNTSEEQKVPQN
ncbi:TP53-regulated inhibitor of apoptosis, putative [Pediculus humanus corporis]|uniref:TP53-regulated inhibitor of apoptosis, putative n=1 Tax=Pediculus humanus subsp. corporis TaxID=121224 RepID=E0VR76_PEDHC|nr:TP53-regulated inhibitor of apoptosis, putative [Pediculus humanus corporis]EEB15882.1 TP53-regulated inhibitor of apoptosis, putative [Pediculus humanus corporis]